MTDFKPSIVLLALAPVGTAQEAAAQGGEHRRPLSADRPDFTESPYTVDAGVIQLESSFVEYASNGRTDSWAVAPTNLKLGLTDAVDLQFVFQPFTEEHDGSSSARGLGDSQLRLKVNLWGNDSGDTAGAVMPFITLPTARDDLGPGRIEGGVIFPVSVALSERVGLGLMAEADWVYDPGDDGYDTELIFTAALSLEATDRLGFYAEGITITSTDPDTDFRGILGLGATYALTPDAVLDAGVNIGLTGDTDDVALFSGITLRF